MRVRAVVFSFLGRVYELMKKRLVWRAHDLCPSIYYYISLSVNTTIY